MGCVSDSCRLSSQTCSPHGHVTVGLPRDAHQRLRRAGGQSVRTRGRQVHRSRIAPCAQSRATWRPGRPRSCARAHATLLARVRARRDSVADRVRPRPAHCGLCLRAPGSSLSRSHGCVSRARGSSWHSGQLTFVHGLNIKDRMCSGQRSVSSGTGAWRRRPCVSGRTHARAQRWAPVSKTLPCGLFSSACGSAGLCRRHGNFSGLLWVFSAWTRRAEPLLALAPGPVAPRLGRCGTEGPRSCALGATGHEFAFRFIFSLFLLKSRGLM